MKKILKIILFNNMSKLKPNQNHVKFNKNFDVFFDKELKNIEKHYNFELFTNWRKFSKLGEIPDQVFHHIGNCKKPSQEESMLISHFAIVKNTLYLRKPFQKPRKFNLTICMDSNITTQLTFSVLDENHLRCNLKRYLYLQKHAID